MSHAPADPHDDQESGHDAHVEATEQADELPTDEPKTPVWLTALGGGLFLLLVVAWLVVRASDGGEASAAAASASASVAAPAPTPPPTVAPPPPAPPPPPPPAPAVAPPATRPAASAMPRYPRPGKGARP